MKESKNPSVNFTKEQKQQIKNAVNNPQPFYVELSNLVVVNKYDLTVSGGDGSRVTIYVEMEVSDRVEANDDYIFDCVLFGQKRKMITTSFDPMGNILTGQIL